MGVVFHQITCNKSSRQQQQHKGVHAGTWEQHNKPTITLTTQ